MDRMGRFVSLARQTLPLRCYYCMLQLSNNSSAKVGADASEWRLVVVEGMMVEMLDLDIAVCEPQDIRKYERSHQEAVGLGRAMVNFKPMCM